MRHLILSNSQMFLIGYRNALTSDFSLADGFVALRHLASLQATKSELLITLWGWNRSSLLAEVSSLNLVHSSCTYRKKRPGHETFGTRCRCSWATMQFRDEAAPEDVCSERALAELLLCQDDANTEGLLGQAQQVTVYLCWKGKISNLVNKSITCCCYIPYNNSDDSKHFHFHEDGASVTKFRFSLCIFVAKKLL